MDQTRGVRQAVQLRREAVQAQAAGPDRDAQMIWSVRRVGEQKSLHGTRSPVAIENAEEQFREAKLRADVRFRRLPGDDAVFLAVPVGIPFQSRVEVRMRHDDRGPEIQRQRSPAGKRGVTGTRFAQRITARV